MALPPGVRRDKWEDPDRRKNVEAEIAFHLQTRIDELVARGVPQAEARQQALEAFGPVGPVAADCREIQTTKAVRTSRLAFVRGFVIELRGTLRQLVRRPGFAAITILTFALGIGATTAVSSLFDGVVVKRLPYRHLDRLVRVWERNQPEGQAAGQLTIADVQDWRAQARRFDGFAGFRWRTGGLATSTGEVLPVTGADVSARFFDLIGVRPLLGRAFLPDDESSHRSESVLLSWRAWRDYFGADSSLVGRTIRLDGVEHRVIGVLPRDFENPVGEAVAYWLANDFETVLKDAGRSRRFHFLSGIARLAPAATFDEAQAELATIGRRIADQYPDQNRGHEPYLVRLQDAGVSTVRPTLAFVLAAVACLLLITCTNLANLVFARALGRVREFAVRRALGAGRWQIVRQVLVEQTILAGAGAALGLGLAAGLVRAGKTGLADLMPRLDQVAIDGRAFLVAAVLAALATVTSGLVPALLAIRPAADGGEGLRSRSGLTRRAVRSRDLLVAVQAALAALLLVAAGLTAKSLSRLSHEEVGFETDRVMTFRIPLPRARYNDLAPVRDFTDRLTARLRTLPGVERVGAAYSFPMDNHSTTSLVVEGSPPPNGPPPSVGYNAADGDYFRVLGIPLVAGRLFEAADRPDSRPVIVVNHALAERFFPGKSPVGARVKSGPDDGAPWLEIVGVVGDIRRQERGVAPAPELYYPLAQDPTSEPSVAMKLGGNPTPILKQVRAAVKELDPDVPMSAPIPLERIIGRSVERPRLLAIVLIGFALLALLVAAVGIYGVISFLVAEREREIAVRLAVGASSRRVLMETTRRGLRPVAIGLAAGIVLALWSGTAVARFLYHVRAADPMTYGIVSAVLLATALVGALIPAIRASRVAPALALKE